MRIAYFVNEFPALSQPFVLNQLAGMIARDHDVHIYATKRVAVDKAHGIVRDFAMMERTRFLYDYSPSWWWRVPQLAGRVLASNLAYHPGVVWRCVDVQRFGRDARTLRLLSAALSINRPRRYDVIHCQFGVLALLALRLHDVGALSGPLVVSIRGFDVTQYLRDKPGFYDEIFPRVRMFLPVSDSMRQRLLALGCDDGRIKILRSGIDCRKFVWRVRSRAPQSALEVLSVGRLVEKKGLIYAIDAVAPLLERGLSIHYRIVGEGPLRETLQARIDQLGIGLQVELLGSMTHEQIVSLLDQSHVFLAPSVTAGDGDQEGIPNVVKEAMATGLPVLSTYHSGIPELVKDGVTGFLVAEKDVTALTARLDFLYHHPEQWPGMAAAARQIIQSEYDQDDLNDRLEALYQRLIE